MASIRLKFRPSAVEGREGALYFQIIHRRVTRTVQTGYRIAPAEWGGESSPIRYVGPPARQAQLRLLASKLRCDMRRLGAIVAERELSEADYTADDVAEAFRLLPPSQTFFGFIRAMAAKKTLIGRHGTAKTYRSALASFAAFRGGEDVAIDALDAETMGQYEAWMRGRGIRRNSSSCYLRTLRTLYRKAVECGLTADRAIFRNVFTGFAKTAKRAVAAGSIRAIRALRLPGGSPLAFARDMFMLSFYLQGMSFVDMAYLKKADVRNGQLRYCRAKTGQAIAVGWEPPMQAIVDEYAHLACGSPYLLPIITRCDGTERRQYERAEHSVNRNLKKVGEMAGLGVALTTYVARHSWASVMRDMGFGLSVISRGLGHENLKTTQIYLSAIDTATVAKANRKMIGRIVR